MERRWWWQRIHPALRVLLFVVYFGAAIAGIAVALVQGTSLSGSAPIAATTTLSADNATATAPGVTETTATPETTATTTPQTSAPAPASGRDLYSAHCASCHGADLQGGIGPELDRGSEASELSDARFVLRVTEGRREMPAFSEQLSSGEIDEVIAYIRSLQGK